ncbi:MAG: hypothetical protein ACREO0_00450 [Pseudoxanthomonas sp.]
MATENPYSAPTAVIGDPVLEVPDDILKKIKHGWVAALFSAGITLLVTLIAMSGTDILGFSAWELIDVALILGLAFGIYKKSRTCAVFMLVYFIISKIVLMAESGQPTGIPMALVFGYFFWQGVSGTFAYHKFKTRRTAFYTSGD